MEADELKRRVNMVELCQRLGLDPKGKVARCPAHNDSDGGRPNLHIYDDHVFCFRCEWTGDAFDLVAKVNRTDFQGAKAYLADFVGLPLIGDYRKSKPSTTSAPRSSAPPSKPLPARASTLAGAVVAPTPKPIVETFADFGAAYRRWNELSETDGARPTLDRYGDTLTPFRVVSMSRDIPVKPLDFDPFGVDIPVKPSSDPGQSLRAKVFADLLTFAKPVVEGDKVKPAGAWLEAEKGISFETQKRFGLCVLDWAAADEGLRKMHDEATLRRFGLLTDKGSLIFRRWREDSKQFVYFTLLFPFIWKGAVVDLQGRFYLATDKKLRFENTRGKNPIPYNADDLVEARRTGKPIFICEGATDTLTLSQSGRLVVGVVGTSGFKAEWLPNFEGLDVYLAYDADDAGHKAARDLTRLFVNAGQPKPKVVNLPTGVKDVNEFFRKANANV